MFSNIFAIGLTLFGLTNVYGNYEVSVTEAEAEHKHVRGTLEQHMECVSQLIVMQHTGRHSYWQAANVVESVEQVYSNGYVYYGILGRVVTKKEGCECGDGTELVPATLMTKKGAYDYFLTTSEDEIAQHKAAGYEVTRIDFYCSLEQNKCGATLPLYRNKGSKQFTYNTRYTTNANQTGIWDKEGWPRDGSICYIWPSQYNCHNRAGQN